MSGNARSDAWRSSRSMVRRPWDHLRARPHRQRQLLPIRPLAPRCNTTNTVVKKTRSRRPQTNGKIERYHRILLEEWAYIRPWCSEDERVLAYRHFTHFYNHHRPHGALGWTTPASTHGDNLPAEHT
jgi:hypothetical protein